MEAQEVTPAQEAAAGPEPPAAARERHAALSTEIDDNLGETSQRNAYDVYTPAGKVTGETMQDRTAVAA